MGDTWTTLPFLGLVPHFHGDPVAGGAPLVSADGHWWWDGTHWTPVHAPTLAEAAAQDEHPVALPTHETAQPTSAWAAAS